jgi:dTDP-4-dehydrorhamnose reductase
VHFSTDYVFDGSKKEGYVEGDKPSPINAYGRSKLAGEKAIQESELGNWHIIRTAWLYGEHGKNFVDTMLSLSKKRESIKVVDDQFGSPTNAVDLAKAIRELIESKAESGIYHRTNKGVTSWYEYAKEIFNAFHVKADVLACSSDEFPRPAKRPKYSILKSTKLPEMNSWQQALQDYQSK